MEEVRKPLRRNEKHILNDEINPRVRFPSSAKVSSSADKAYLLMQAAVGRLHFQSFTLRIEQDNILEKALRVLGALQDLCVHRLYGGLLRCVLELERSFRFRMWRCTNVFSQCDKISMQTVENLSLRSLTTLESFNTLSSIAVMGSAGCSLGEAMLLMQFHRDCTRSKMTMNIKIESDELIVSITPFDALTEETSNSGVSYHLIVYHKETKALLCFRKLPGIIESEFKVRVNNIKLSDVICTLLSNIFELDLHFNSDAMDQEGPVADDADVKIRRRKRNNGRQKQKTPKQPKITEFGYFPTSVDEGKAADAPVDITNQTFEPNAQHHHSQSAPVHRINTRRPSSFENESTFQHDQGEHNGFPTENVPRRTICNGESQSMSPDLVEKSYRSSKQAKKFDEFAFTEDNLEAAPSRNLVRHSNELALLQQKSVEAGYRAEDKLIRIPLTNGRNEKFARNQSFFDDQINVPVPEVLVGNSRRPNRQVNDARVPVSAKEKPFDQYFF